jgi:hypothetical protein
MYRRNRTLRVRCIALRYNTMSEQAQQMGYCIPTDFDKIEYGCSWWDDLI